MTDRIAVGLLLLDSVEGFLKSFPRSNRHVGQTEHLDGIIIL
jgi:hypothetical protein